ncbi:MAG: hypothetical protein M1831_003700 [Alyxoria varia]|nr:MAG: hypothetical protein M1831_003700 [Alyxoria varia]
MKINQQFLAHLLAAITITSTASAVAVSTPDTTAVAAKTEAHQLAGFKCTLAGFFGPDEAEAWCQLQEGAEGLGIDQKKLIEWVEKIKSEEYKKMTVEEKLKLMEEDSDDD